MTANREPALYATIGGVVGCRKLSAEFYALVDRDPLLRPLFPGSTLRCAIEEFTAFLIQFLGGPPEHTQRRWWVSLRESHLRFKIGPEHRAAWMKCMVQALDIASIDEAPRSELRRFFQESSAYLVNQSQPPNQVQGRAGVEVTQRWTAQRSVDDAVAAIRGLNATVAIERTQLCAGPSVAGLLAAMVASRDDAMRTYVRERLSRDPSLLHARYGGRTLLHQASAYPDPPLIVLLLRLGADPNAKTGGGHTPLYCVANECGVPGGGEVVRMLVQAGGKVDAADGVKHCTPLHMAARRGNVEVAEALLACSADIEARDSAGDTPLRRSVNCNQIEVAALLLARGADPRSVGSKGLTPIAAARTDAMRRLLRENYA